MNLKQSTKPIKELINDNKLHTRLHGQLSKACRKKGLIKKTDVKILHNYMQYPRFWLSDAGVYVALIEGADAQDLLEKTIKIYPNNENLQLLLEMAPFTGIEIYKMAFSAILSKGKIEQSDIFVILLTQMQRNLTIEQYNQFLKILRKRPDQYEKITKQIKQLAEILEEKEK